MIPIPKGWQRIRNTTVKRGDRIRTADGWAEADNLSKPDAKGEISSAIGHPTALYECVIRQGKNTDA